MKSLGWPVWGATVLSTLVVGFGILFFVQAKDPVALIFGSYLAGLVWIVAGVIHVLRRGIPVRIVGEDRGRR